MEIVANSILTTQFHNTKHNLHLWAIDQSISNFPSVIPSLELYNLNPLIPQTSLLPIIIWDGTNNSAARYFYEENEPIPNLKNAVLTISSIIHQSTGPKDVPYFHPPIIITNLVAVKLNSQSN